MASIEIFEYNMSYRVRANTSGFVCDAETGRPLEFFCMGERSRGEIARVVQCSELLSRMCG